MRNLRYFKILTFSGYVSQNSRTATMNNEIIRLRIVTQNALLGKITKEVRGVYVKIDKNCISICVVIDGPISDYWNEEIYEIGTSIISNFNENYNIDENLIRVDYPISLSFDNYLCVYKRYEDEGNLYT